jgi:hypothetical protein
MCVCVCFDECVWGLRTDKHAWIACDMCMFVCIYVWVFGWINTHRRYEKYVCVYHEVCMRIKSMYAYIMKYVCVYHEVCMCISYVVVADPRSNDPTCHFSY